MGAQIRVGGNRYPGRYVEAGSGEPLILVHGQGGHIENFSRNIMAFARYYHVFALDSAWHGLGPQPPFDPEIVPTLIDQIMDFMDWQGIDSANVEGQSMGGWIAMRLAYEHPARVKKLVLAVPLGFRLNPSLGETIDSLPLPSLRERQISFLMDPTWEHIRQRIADLFARPDQLPDEVVDARLKLYNMPEVNAGLLKVAQAYIGGPDSLIDKHVMTELELAKMIVPTLVYWTDHNLISTRAGELLANSIPAARYFCAKNSGHWAQFENAEEHNRQVLRFLTGDSMLEPD
jgi:pimeloyl-ACP methyl ester carboxylesterase